MTDYSKLISDMEAEDDALRASQAVTPQGQLPTTDFSNTPATARAVLRSATPQTQVPTWEQMGFVEKVVNGTESGYHNLLKSRALGKAYDRLQAEDIGLSALVDDDEDESVKELLARDTQANRDYQKKLHGEGMEAAYEYSDLAKKDSEYATPVAIQRAAEAGKGKGFWAGTGAALSEMSKDPLNSMLYLGTSSFGAIAPYIALSALGGAGTSALGLTTAARAVSAAIMYSGSYQNEYGSYIADKLREDGIDLSNADALATALKSDKAREYADKANKRAQLVAAFDAVAGYAEMIRLNPSNSVRRLRNAMADMRATAVPGETRISDFADAFRLADGTPKTRLARWSAGAENIGTQAALQGVLGGAGEATGALAAGDPISWGDVLFEAFGEFSSAPVEVVTMTAGIQAEYKQREQIAQAQQAIQQQTQRITAATNAIAHQLQDGQTVEQWASELGQDKVVFAFAQDLVDAGVVEAVAQVNPELAESITRAAEEKSDVSIPVSEVVRMAAQDNALADKVLYESRVDADGMSPHNADDFMKGDGKKEAVAAFEKIISDAKPDMATRKEIEDEVKAIRESLKAAGVADDVADLQTRPWASWLAIRAKQTGLKPKEIMEKINLRIRRNAAGGLNQGVVEETTSEIEQPAELKPRPTTGERVAYAPALEKHIGKSAKLRKAVGNLISLMATENQKDIVAVNKGAKQIRYQKDINERVRRAAEAAGIDLTDRDSEVTRAVLVNTVVNDAFYVTEANPSAIGWYDEKVRKCLGFAGAIFPELDPHNKEFDKNEAFRFLYALATTSNGLRVAQNLPLAVRIYDEYKRTGVLPAWGEGTQAEPMIKTLADFSKTQSTFDGIDQMREFFMTTWTVRQMELMGYDAGGEGKDETVRGAAIIGPKIGNGFFVNLNGVFSALTMDRWFMRTYGRWTGTLISFDRRAFVEKVNNFRSILNEVRGNKEFCDWLKEFGNFDVEKAIAIKTSAEKMADSETRGGDKVSPFLRMVKRSAATFMPAKFRRKYSSIWGGKDKPDSIGWRFYQAMKAVERNAVSDKVAPAGSTERAYIRSIFNEALDVLHGYEGMQRLTMADLQAALWYAEKKIYENTKSEGEFVEDYEQDDAPDYANVMRDVAIKRGVPMERLKEIANRIDKEIENETANGEGSGGARYDTLETKTKADIFGTRGFGALRRDRRLSVADGEEQGERWSAVYRAERPVASAGVLDPVGSGQSVAPGLDDTGGRGRRRAVQPARLSPVATWVAGSSVSAALKENQKVKERDESTAAPKFNEYAPTEKTATAFLDALKAAKKELGPAGACVEEKSIEELTGQGEWKSQCRIFLSEDGKSGFVIKNGDDLVSVFSAKGNNSGDAVVECAIAAGARRLDCFNTILPRLYSRHGFRPVARLKFNRDYAPYDWDYGFYAKYNSGEPDVVFMVYDNDYDGNKREFLTEMDNLPETDGESYGEPYHSNGVAKYAKANEGVQVAVDDANARAAARKAKKAKKSEPLGLAQSSLNAEAVRANPEAEFERPEPADVRTQDPAQPPLSALEQSGYNPGYYGGRSVRAAAAEAEGGKPWSRWTKADVLAELEYEYGEEYPELVEAAREASLGALKAVVLENREWHHVGTNYRPTAYFFVRYLTGRDDAKALISELQGYEKTPNKIARVSVQGKTLTGEVSGGTFRYVDEGGTVRAVTLSNRAKDAHMARQVEDVTDADEADRVREAISSAAAAKKEGKKRVRFAKVQLKDGSIRYAKVSGDVARLVPVAYPGKTWASTRRVEIGPDAEILEEETDANRAQFASDILTAKIDATEWRLREYGKTMSALDRYETDLRLIRLNRAKDAIDGGKAKPLNDIAILQTAYHGSPYIFDKFTLDHIGAGEGAQAHGWGLYFALDHEVARSYRDKLSGGHYLIGGRDVDAVRKEVERKAKPGAADSQMWLERLEAFDEWYAHRNPDAVREAHDEGTVSDGAFRWFETEIRPEISSEGRLYTADIPEDDVMLREGADFDHQPPKVQEALRKAMAEAEKKKDRLFKKWKKEAIAELGREEHGPLFYFNDTRVKLVSLLKEAKSPDDVLGSMEDSEFWRVLRESFEVEKKKALAEGIATEEYADLDVGNAGENVLRELRKLRERIEDFPDLSVGDVYEDLVLALGSQKKASLFLNRHGIKGIRYHGQEDGECAVVWDDEAIRIVEQLEQEKAASQNGARGSFMPQNASDVKPGGGGVLTLMQTADKSTFLHESAHAWLDADTMLAQDIAEKALKGEELTTGERAFLANLGGFFRWGQQEGVISLGVTDDIQTVARAVQQWAKLDIAAQRGMHELFAEGFESYLMEGISPNPEMKTIFGRFKKWLMDIYAQATKQPHPISPEVRKLYDLMFATEQQVQDTQQKLGLRALFDGQIGAQLGMTPDEMAAYQALNDAATQEAEGLVAKAVHGVMRIFGRVRRKEAARILREHKEEVAKRTDEILAEPRYQALSLLTYGAENPDGTRTRMTLSLESMSRCGIDAETVGILMDRGYVTQGKGVTPEVFASMAGTSDFVGLIADLLEIKSMNDARQEAIASVAYRERVEAGESVDKFNELQANLAAYNETRSRFLVAEFNALARAGGSRQLMVQAAREYAVERIGGMRLSQIYPNAYMSAERRCAKLAEEAVRKGDFKAALEAKRGQILNHEMARAALEARDRYERGVRMARRALKSKTIHPKFKQMILALLENHSVSNMKAEDRKKFGLTLPDTKELLDMAAELMDAGTPIEGLEAFLGSREHAREMTAYDSEDFFSVLKQLQTVGRNFLRQRLDEELGRIDDVIKDARAAITKAADEQKRPVLQNQRRPMTRVERFKDTVMGFLLDHVKIATWCRIFDRNKDGGLFWSLFVRSANDRANFENFWRQKVTQNLAEKFASVFTKNQDEDPIIVPGFDRPFTHGMRLAVALNWGNESNRERLLSGDPRFAENDAVTVILEHLTEADWRAVEAVWQQFEELRPLIAEKEERVYGIAPKWIDYKPFTVKTAEGKTIKVSGGYYPVKFDERGSNRADKNSDADKTKQEMRGAYQSATTRRSFTKSRVEGEVKMPLRLDLSALYEGLNDVIHDLAWHEWLIETKRLLDGVHGDGSGLRATIKERYGYDVAKQFEEWRKDIAQGGRDIEGSQIAKFTGNVGAATMGYSVTSAVVQITGVGYVIPRVGLPAFSVALGKLIANPGKLRREINEQSEAMRLRSITMNREISQIRNQLEQGRSWLREHAYVMLTTVQAIVDGLCWQAAYERFNREGYSGDKLIALCDQTVIDTQSSGNINDLSRIERDPGLKRILTVFYSWANAALNLELCEALGEHDRAKAVGKILFMACFMPVLEDAWRSMLKASGGDDDDENAALKLLRGSLGAVVEYHLGLLVGVREIANAGKSLVAGEPMFGYSGPAGTRLLANANSGVQALNDPLSWKGLRAAIDLAGTVTGLPATQLNRTVKGLRAIESGDAEGLDAVKAPIFGYSGRISE